MSALTDLKLFGPAGYLLGEAAWGPAGCRGADKVAQRFVYALLTPVGSVPGLTTSGTPFLSLAAAFRSEFDLYAAFAASYGAAVAAVQAAEGAGEPAAEKFGAAAMTGVSVSADAVVVRLVVRAADGSAPVDPVDVTLET